MQLVAGIFLKSQMIGKLFLIEWFLSLTDILKILLQSPQNGT